MDNLKGCVVGQDVLITRVVGEDTTSITADGVPRSITFEVSLSYAARRWQPPYNWAMKLTYGASQYVELSSIVSFIENGLAQLALSVGAAVVAIGSRQAAFAMVLRMEAFMVAVCASAVYSALR